MDVFDLIGPVMVGPSSSHTAGVVRIGNVAYRMLGREPEEADVWFSGSFAATWRGHGSDKAIVAGMLGMGTDDERIRDSIRLAQVRSIPVRIHTEELPDAHPNTVRIRARRGPVSAELTGESVGGGNIRITELSGIRVSFDGKYHTLIIRHRDSPGAVAGVTGALARHGVNIAAMNVYRAARGGEAIMVIEADQPISEELSAEISNQQAVAAATVLPSLFERG